jgi:serine/threonine protein kinase
MFDPYAPAPSTTIPVRGSGNAYSAALPSSIMAPANAGAAAAASAGASLAALFVQPAPDADAAFEFDAEPVRQRSATVSVSTPTGTNATAGVDGAAAIVLIPPSPVVAAFSFGLGTAAAAAVRQLGAQQSQLQSQQPYQPQQNTIRAAGGAGGGGGGGVVKATGGGFDACALQFDDYATPAAPTHRPAHQSAAALAAQSFDPLEFGSTSAASAAASAQTQHQASSSTGFVDLDFGVPASTGAAPSSQVRAHTQPLSHSQPQSQSQSQPRADRADSPASSAFASGTGEFDYGELQLGDRIGIGAFAEVFKAVWRGGEVAVKRLLANNQTPESVAEFWSEVAVMRRLNHLNIVAFRGACQNPSCVVTELLQGNLWDLLHNSRLELPFRLRMRMLQDAALGMSHLHAFNPPIVHRDLKSANLLYDKAFRVKVGDFGLSRAKEVQYTMTGQCGTFQWMSPEVMQSQRYTEKADVFSFGIILWEVLFRQVPYQGMNSVQVSIAVITQNLRPPIPADTPAELARLMQECWATVCVCVCACVSSFSFSLSNSPNYLSINPLIHPLSLGLPMCVSFRPPEPRATPSLLANHRAAPIHREEILRINAARDVFGAFVQPRVSPPISALCLSSFVLSVLAREQ